MSFSLVKYLKDVVKRPESLVSKKKLSMRILIEGGDHQGWRNSQLDMMCQDIPEDITCLNIDDIYSFDLVGLIKPDGTLEERTANPEQSRTLSLEYSILLGIPRPTTIIIEDGRVFHDLSLLNSDIEVNNQRLKLFLKSIVEKYGRKESFEKTYKQLQNQSSYANKD